MNLIKKHRNSSGFTLVEIAIVILIIGLFMASAAQLAKQYYLERQKDYEIESIDEITNALADFVKDQTDLGPPVVLDTSVHFPCPADPTIAPGAANFGVERRVGAAPFPVGARCAVVGGIVRVDPNGAPFDSDDIYIGSIPTTTLDISSKYMSDAYGHRYTYAVSHDVSTSMALDGANPAGAITVTDFDNLGAPTGAVSTGVPFIIVSHGPDGNGAFTIEGAPVAGGCAAAIGSNVENCNNDQFFYDGNFQRSISGGVQDYDDTTVFSLKGIREDDEYWDLNPGDSTEIYNVNTGNVGIGLANPQDQLHVGAGGGGGLRVDNYISVENPGVPSAANIGNQGAIQAGSAFSGAGFIETAWIYTNGCIEGDSKGGTPAAICLGSNAAGGVTQNTFTRSDEIALVTQGVSRVFVTPAGDVGIGNTAPAQMLDVSGNIRAVTFLHSSDKRLKTNITNLGRRTLEQVMMLRIIKYHLLSDNPEERKKIGLIAQNLQEYFPELVHEGNDGILSVDYVGLIGPTIKALQELRTEKDEQVEKLNDTITELTKRLELLETKISGGTSHENTDE